MQQKGKYIEGGKCLGKVLFAVSEVMFDIVSSVFEYVMVLIFDFPAGASKVANIGNRGIGEWMVGDKSVLIYLYAFVVFHSYFAPIDQQRIATSAYRESICITIMISKAVDCDCCLK